MAEADVDRDEAERRPVRKPRWPWGAAIGGLVLAVPVALGLIFTAGQDGSSQGQPTPAASMTSAPRNTSPPDRDGDGTPDASDPYPDDPKNTPTQAPITMVCYLNKGFTQSSALTVTFGKDGSPDFMRVWAAGPVSCQVRGPVTPVTAVEQTAYQTSKYTDNNIGTLYVICAEVDPTAAYAEAGFTPSPEQISEINAALTPCPNHPLGANWRQAVYRGKAKADLAAQGRLFGPGTFLVGKEIQAGTYFTTDVEGCYWERQNKSGGTIENDFIVSARRVEVTISTSDYAFHSQRCGEWKPVGSTG